MLYHQVTLVAQITRDINHPAIKEALAGAEKVIEGIHNYGKTKGKYIYVGSWPCLLVAAAKTLPYPLPRLDFITISPTVEEVSNKELNKLKWEKVILSIKQNYGDIPVFAYLDWSFDISQIVVFSQKLNKEEQKEVLGTFDKSFGEMGVNFVYPVHGGYLGRGEITKYISFGKFRIYDSLAPEFDTFETIKKLARIKAGEPLNEGINKTRGRLGF